jgi:hypothetical protein
MRKERGASEIQMSPKGDDGAAKALLASDMHNTGPTFTLSNILLGVFTALSVASVLTIVVLAAIKENARPPTAEGFVSCAFRTVFTNWNDFGFDPQQVSCPTVGQAFPCVRDDDCVSLSPLCLPGGGTPYLSCLSLVNFPGQQYCGFDSFAMPGLSVAGGVCNASGLYSTCALCNGSTCAGQALCVRPSDCSKSFLVCYPSGNTVET